MTKLRILAAAGTAVPALALGLSMSPAKAGLNPGDSMLLVRSEAVIPRQFTPPGYGIGLPRVMNIEDRMDTQQQMSNPSSSPTAGGGMSGGGMMDDDTAMPAQRPMPNPSISPPMGGGMSGGGKMMDGKMAMPPTAPDGSNAGPMSTMPMPPAGPSAGGSMAPTGMMRGMQMMMRGQPSAPLDHIEGRIAFLKAELGITDAQAQAWDPFAQALRAGRQHLVEARQALSIPAGQSSSLSRLDAYEHHLSMRLDALRTARETFGRLYGALNDTQKQKADELVVPFLEAF